MNVSKTTYNFYVIKSAIDWCWWEWDLLSLRSSELIAIADEFLYAALFQLILSTWTFELNIVYSFNITQQHTIPYHSIHTTNTIVWAFHWPYIHSMCSIHSSYTRWGSFVFLTVLYWQVYNIVFECFEDVQNLLLG